MDAEQHLIPPQKELEEELGYPGDRCRRCGTPGQRRGRRCEKCGKLFLSKREGNPPGLDDLPANWMTPGT